MEEATTSYLKSFQHFKSLNPDAIHLFRTGDVYETYEQDAIDTSKVLGLSHTYSKGKSGFGVNNPDGAIFNFPFYALDTYLPKLIRAGKRVAILDQLELPKKDEIKHGYDLKELVTPGLTMHVVNDMKDVSDILSEEAMLRDTLIEKMRSAGIKVSTDVVAAEKVLEQVNGNVRLMGSRVNKKQISISRFFEGKELTEKQRAFVDVYSGKKNETSIKIVRPDRQFNLSIISGKEEGLGVKHSLLKHFATTIGVFNELDILKISDIIEKGDCKVANSGYRKRNIYQLTNNGTRYTVVTEVRKNKEIFGDFYTNQKARPLDNEMAHAGTLEGAGINSGNALSAAKVQRISETAKEKEDNFLKKYDIPAVSLHRYVEEMQNEDTEDIRYHLAYHGSGNDFDEFDHHNHIGEGEGSQVYGWGTYLTEVEGIGRMYAEQGRGKILYNNKNWDDLWHSEHTPGVMAALDVMERRENFENYETFEESIEKIRHDAEQAIESFGEDESYTGSVTHYREKISALETMRETDFSHKKKILYTVEIPDDNGKNYLRWDKKVPLKVLKNISHTLDQNNINIEIPTPRFTDGGEVFSDTLGKLNWLVNNSGAVNKGTGQDLYEVLSLILHNVIKTSTFLNELGFTGIRYPAEFQSGGREDEANNYVIFSEDDIKIKDKLSFFKTQQGQAYGFVHNGTIYIDPRISTAETPLHEYTHLWAEVLRQRNPDEWKNIVTMMKDIPDLWNYVRRVYPSLATDNEIADEVLAHFSGKRGYERLKEMAKETSEPSSLLDRISSILEKFWSNVATFFSVHYTTKEEVADRILFDLLREVNPLNYKTADFVGIRESQELPINSQNFKAWFGDWEKNPENASKVVDKEGKPLIVEHGTNNDFTEFDINRLGETSHDKGIYGAGFYFATEAPAWLNARNKMKVYLDIKKPFEITASMENDIYTSFSEKLDTPAFRALKLHTFNDKEISVGEYIDVIKAVDDFIEHNPDQVNEQIAQDEELQSYHPKDRFQLWREHEISRRSEAAILSHSWNVIISSMIGSEEFTKAAKESGYDGVIVDRGNDYKEYVVFDSNQIKSATNNIGTFRKESNDINEHRVDLSFSDSSVPQRLSPADIEAGGALVDRLNAMGIDVHTDIQENRKVLKAAEHDNSEAGKLRYFKTENGTSYGFAYHGSIYLDPRKIDAELPLHEFAHLWCQALRRINPKNWENVVSTIKEDSASWNFVKDRYPDLTDENDLVEEVIAQYSGKRGAVKLQAELQRMTSKDENYRSRWNAVFSNISKVIQDFWKHVGDSLNIQYKNKEDIADKILQDFAQQVNPVKKVEKWLKERDNLYADAVKNQPSLAVQLFEEALKENVGNGVTPFISVGTYRGNMDVLARKVKSDDDTIRKQAIEKAADCMAALIPANAVLIPAPSHLGYATNMLELANAISERTNAEVADILKGDVRESQHNIKKRTGKPMSSEELNFRIEGELHKGKLPVVIDNVVNSGNTAEACVKALGGGLIVSLASATSQEKHVASLKSAAPIVYDKKGNLIPLSERFELKNKWLGRIIPLNAEYSKEMSNQNITKMEKEDYIKILTDLIPNKGDAITFEKGIALDDRIGVNSIGDMLVNEVFNAGNGEFFVSDGERAISFSRMMEWNQEDVIKEAQAKIRQESQLSKSPQQDLSEKIKEMSAEIHQLIRDENLEYSALLPRLPLFADLSKDWREDKHVFSHAMVTIDDIILYENNYDAYDNKNGISIKELSEEKQLEALDIIKEHYGDEQREVTVHCESVPFPVSLLPAINGDTLDLSAKEISIFEDFKSHNPNAVFIARKEEPRFEDNTLLGEVAECLKVDIFRYVTVAQLKEEKRLDDLGIYFETIAGKEYPLRDIELPTGETVSVATEELQQLLDQYRDKEGNFVDSSAAILDKKIEYYVPSEKLMSASGDELSSLIMKEGKQTAPDPELSNRLVWMNDVFNDARTTIGDSFAIEPVRIEIGDSKLVIKEIRFVEDKNGLVNEGGYYAGIDETGEETPLVLAIDSFAEANDFIVAAYKAQISHLIGEGDSIDYIDGYNVAGDKTVTNVGFKDGKLNIQGYSRDNTRFEFGSGMSLEAYGELTENIKDMRKTEMQEDWQSEARAFLVENTGDNISSDMIEDFLTYHWQNELSNEENLINFQQQQKKQEETTKAETKAVAAVALSPMLKQFLDLKQKHPDALLLFRTGDFYETYKQDAEKASKILGIILTKSYKTKDEQGKPLVMAGFPYHALDTYLPKLIRAGEHVAICDQLEAPKQTPKRGITELVSPSVDSGSSVEQLQEKPYHISYGEDNRPGGVFGDVHVELLNDSPRITWDEAKALADDHGGKIRVMNGHIWGDFTREADAVQFADKMIALNVDRMVEERQAGKPEKSLLAPLSAVQMNMMSELGYPYAPGNAKQHDNAPIPDMVYWRVAAGLLTVEQASRALDSTGYTVGIDMERTHEILTNLNTKYGKLDSELKPLTAPITHISENKYSLTQKQNSEEQIMNPEDKKKNENVEQNKAQQSVAPPTEVSAETKQAKKRPFANIDYSQYNNLPEGVTMENVKVYPNKDVENSWSISAVVNGSYRRVPLYPNDRRAYFTKNEDGSQRATLAQLAVKYFANPNWKEKKDQNTKQAANQESQPPKAQEVNEDHDVIESTEETPQEATQKVNKKKPEPVSAVEVGAALLSSAITSSIDHDGVWMNKDGKSAPRFTSEHQIVSPFNAMMMNLHSDANGYKSNVYTNFKQAGNAGYSVKRDQKSLPFSWVKLDGYVNKWNRTDNISDEAFKKLTPEQQADYKRNRVHETWKIFNIDQTLMSSTSKDKYKELISVPEKSKDTVAEGVAAAYTAMFSRGENVEVSLSKQPSYDAASDTLILKSMESVADDEKVTVAAENYRVMVEALSAPSRLNIGANFSNLPSDQAKYEKLIQEISTGVILARQGVPAQLSKENYPLIPFWHRELVENPTIVTQIERDVNNVVSVIGDLRQGKEINFSAIRGEKPIESLKTRSYTIASFLATIPTIESKQVVIIKDEQSKTADIILPKGASVEVDNETPGLNKARFAKALAKQGYADVKFYNAGGSFALNKANDYFAGKDIITASLKQYNIIEQEKIDVSQELAQAGKKEIEKVALIKDDDNQFVLYVKPKGEEPFTIYPQKEDLRIFFNNVKTDRFDEVKDLLGQKYYGVVQKHPDLKASVLVPQHEEVDLSRISEVKIFRAKDKDATFRIYATVDGVKQEPVEITRAQFERAFLAVDRELYKTHLAAAIFGEKLKIQDGEKIEQFRGDQRGQSGDKTGKDLNEGGKKPEASTTQQEEQKTRSRRGLH